MDLLREKLSLTKILKLNLKFKEEYIANKMKAAVQKFSNLNKNKQIIDLDRRSVDPELRSLELSVDK